MPIDLSPFPPEPGPGQATQPLPSDAGRVLLPLARAAIAAQLGLAHAAADDMPWLKSSGASFITLMLGHKLRGCVGTLRAHRALAEDVKANAVAAAFRDPRFPPLGAAEFSGVALEVSVLSALEPLAFADERDALSQLRAEQRRAGVGRSHLVYGPRTAEQYARLQAHNGQSAAVA